MGFPRQTMFSAPDAPGSSIGDAMARREGRRPRAEAAIVRREVGPRPGEVLLCRTEVPSLSATAIARIGATLSRDEQARAARFVRDGDRAVFVAAHALLRHALGSVLEGPLRFRTGAHGKPELDLDGDHGVHFNLSHTAGMAVCAICRDRPVGVDVEAIDPGIDVEMLAQRYFTASEHALIASAASGRRAELFFRLWTLKEAVLKAIGVGLSAPLRGVAFTLDSATSELRLARADMASAWRVRDDAPTPGHRLAIALPRSPAPPATIVSRLIPVDTLA